MAEDIKTESSNTKTTEERRPLTLYNLPPHIFDIVTDKLPLIDCLALRKVSRDLRSLVNSSKVQCKAIDFSFEDGQASMDFDGTELKYEEWGVGGYTITSENDIRECKIYQDGGDFKQAFIADASTFLEMPKLEIGRIRLTEEEDSEIQEIPRFAELEFLKLLKSLSHRLNVKSMWSKDLELLDSVQEFLNPEKLEKLYYNCNISVSDFIEIANANLQTLKNPKLKLNCVSFRDYSDESSAKFSKILKSLDYQLCIESIVVRDWRWIDPILQFLNPKRVEIRCNEFKFSEENLVKIRSLLLKSPCLQFFKLENRSGRNNETNEIVEDRINETIDRVMSQNPSYDASTRRFSILNSNDYFQLRFRRPKCNINFLFIEKIFLK